MSRLLPLKKIKYNHTKEYLICCIQDFFFTKPSLGKIGLRYICSPLQNLFWGNIIYEKMDIYKFIKIHFVTVLVFFE